jgi:hypothetical protein
MTTITITLPDDRYTPFFLRRPPASIPKPRALPLGFRILDGDQRDKILWYTGCDLLSK